MSELPVGVIAPYRWGSRSIPVIPSGLRNLDAMDAQVIHAMRQFGSWVAAYASCARSMQLCLRLRQLARDGSAFTPIRRRDAAALAKPMTSLCALLLMDMGRIDLDMPVLPLLARIGIKPASRSADLPDAKIAAITIRHLMDHTSGLPEHTAYTAWRPNLNLAELHGLTALATAHDAARDALGNARLEANPGKSYRYANANFVLLARVVEAAAGMPFHDCLRIFWPLRSD